MSDDAMVAQAGDIGVPAHDFERLRSALGQALSLPMSMLIGPLEQATAAMGEWGREVQRLQNTWDRSVWGTKAPDRKRKRRVAKKLAARGGYMRYGSLGAKSAGWGLL